MKSRVLLVLTLAVVFSVTAIAQEKEKKFAFELSGGPWCAIGCRY